MKSYLPEPALLLNLEPEEIALYLLPYLNHLEGQNAKLNIYNLLLDTSHDFQTYVNGFHDVDGVKKALSEAFQWLLTQGYLASNPTNSVGWVFVTRRGKKIKDKADFEKSSYIKLLPYERLDERLREKIISPYIRGEFENCVFNSYKHLEIRIREKAELDNTWFGVKLANKAFDPKNGLLIDSEMTDIEKNASAN